ncbi:MAG: hypothetical protein HY711_00860, partial [Candidatus Melainabacteria bacterium]|nr:hypothetical protein [Candidatus Melainabacteria bacterium]
SDEFKKAYEEDVAKIPPADREILAYYLQDGHAGRDEAFADLYATIHGGPANAWQKQLLEKYFPNTIKAIKEKEASIK